MSVTVRSFAKINLGLYIGTPRPDGFHDLRTLYQTIGLHDEIRVEALRGTGIEIICADPRVPCNETNTCWRVAERVIAELGVSAKVRLTIKKRLPVQGGMGAASSNAVATMIGLERVLSKRLLGSQRLRVASAVGSDLPLFLVGGTVWGVGRGEEVYPAPDLPVTPVVVVTPDVGVSTPKAFAEWDAQIVANAGSADPPPKISGSQPTDKLTRSAPSDRLLEVGRVLSAWLSGSPNTGAPAKGGSRAGSLLLDLVRTGIENDFEKVVFPNYPELRDIKSAIEHTGAEYASLSGSGSTLYGLYRTRELAARAVKRLLKQGLKAQSTETLTRAGYWKRSVVVSR